MFDQIVATIEAYPYLGVALVFLLCGIGLPLPEEIVLLAAGYVCARSPNASLAPMMAWCAGAIVVGDALPFVLGRVFGVRLLRLRWLRLVITKQRLASFDHWFRRRGDLVIVISRFLAGLRVVAFFTAGAMKMPWTRFLLLDGLGIALMVPLLTWIGYRSANFIEDIVAKVQQIERGILIGVLIASALVALWYWLWRRRRRRASERRLTEAYVQPKQPVRAGATATGAEAPPTADPAHAAAPATPSAGAGSVPAANAPTDAPTGAPTDTPRRPLDEADAGRPDRSPDDDGGS